MLNNSSTYEMERHTFRLSCYHDNICAISLVILVVSSPAHVISAQCSNSKNCSRLLLLLFAGRNCQVLPNGAKIGKKGFRTKNIRRFYFFTNSENIWPWKSKKEMAFYIDFWLFLQTNWLRAWQKIWQCCCRRKSFFCGLKNFEFAIFAIKFAHSALQHPFLRSWYRL